MTTEAPSVTRFEVHVASPLSAASRRASFTTEADARALAGEWVGPKQDQVSIVAHTADVETFAIRHFVWEAGTVVDTGWRRWAQGEFIGGQDGALSFAEATR